MLDRTDVLLVGYEDRDNLGLRYLKSAVVQAGFNAKIVNYQSDPHPLLELARREQPTLIGFSLIFQYMAPDFDKVIGALKKGGTTAHITTGGHYPSFDYDEVLRRIPGLDSVVRFEGEATLVELLRCLRTKEDWHALKGIAFCEDGKSVATPLREPISDLDTLPWPERADFDYESQELPTASILGSRGCPWKCSFCSIRPFYEAQGGRLRRLRRPDAVVAEMEYLYRNRNVSIFLFQDDDFLAGGRSAREWACAIADGLAAARMTGKIAYKMSCRSDEIDAHCLSRLLASGLSHVYMGVESGDEQGLINMNKRLKPSEHLSAARTLKSLGLSFDFGFMLLDPYSTLDSVRNNIRFLQEFVGDGWTIASFCRMLPYAGTPTKTRLEAEGRLLGTPFEPDYRFLDPKLDIFYDWMLRTFYERNFTNSGLCNVLRSLLFEAHLRLDGRSPMSSAHKAYLHHLTAIANGVAFYTLRTAIDYLAATALGALESDTSFLDGLTRYEREEEQALLNNIADFYWLFRQRSGDHMRSITPQLLGGFENSWTLESNYGSRILAAS